MDIKDLEKQINQLENLASTLSQLKNPILEQSMGAFTFLFEKGTDGKALYENMEKKDIQDTINSMDEDLVPLFEEFEYQEGIQQVKEWKKLLAKNLE
tara:strand:- start:2015 stop:2305 length:291 start_codon:yes stop_codon:yes gene_type:complete